MFTCSTLTATGSNCCPLPSITDADDGPVIRDLTGIPRVTESWGLPPRLSWLKNASPFEGVPHSSPSPGGAEPSLEAYLHMT
jgi:catechol 2,3-dioxygenase